MNWEQSELKWKNQVWQCVDEIIKRLGQMEERACFNDYFLTEQDRLIFVAHKLRDKIRMNKNEIKWCHIIGKEIGRRIEQLNQEKMVVMKKKRDQKQLQINKKVAELGE